MTLNHNYGYFSSVGGIAGNYKITQQKVILLFANTYKL